MEDHKYIVIRVAGNTPGVTHRDMMHEAHVAVNEQIKGSGARVISMTKAERSIPTNLRKQFDSAQKRFEESERKLS